MAQVTSEPNLIFEQDVAYGAANSEALFNKIGGTHNYFLDNFDVYPFGVSGASYSTLSVYPYEFNANIENVRANSVIKKVHVYSGETGTANYTDFMIQYQLAAGGGWNNIFSTNPLIQNTAADGVSFATGDLVTPPGVTLPVLGVTTLAKNDKLRFVLINAATDANNLIVKVILRPTA